MDGREGLAGRHDRLWVNGIPDVSMVAWRYAKAQIAERKLMAVSCDFIGSDRLGRRGGKQ